MMHQVVEPGWICIRRDGGSCGNEGYRTYCILNWLWSAVTSMSPGRIHPFASFPKKISIRWPLSLPSKEKQQELDFLDTSEYLQLYQLNFGPFFWLAVKGAYIRRRDHGMAWSSISQRKCRNTYLMKEAQRVRWSIFSTTEVWTCGCFAVLSIFQLFPGDGCPYMLDRDAM